MFLKNVGGLCLRVGGFEKAASHALYGVGRVVAVGMAKKRLYIKHTHINIQCGRVLFFFRRVFLQ